MVMICNASKVKWELLGVVKWGVYTIVQLYAMLALHNLMLRPSNVSKK